MHPCSNKVTWEQRAREAGLSDVPKSPKTVYITNVAIYWKQSPLGENLIMRHTQ